MQSLLIIDGLNMIRRIYEANPVEDSPLKADAVLSAASASFRRALSTHQPTHCLWTFDYGGHTWRHDLYPDYKKDRKPMPTHLARGVEEFKVRLANGNWAIAEKPGTEADDLIGSAVHCLSGQFSRIIVQSTDKDLTWLMIFGAEIYNHFERSFRDAAWCQKKFGVEPGLMLDFLALVGDATDGIPGVPKVGPVTASKWLNEHGSLEGVLAAASSIKGAVGERLRENLDLARLSRKLTNLRLESMSEDELTLSTLTCGIWS